MAPPLVKKSHGLVAAMLKCFGWLAAVLLSAATVAVCSRRLWLTALGKWLTVPDDPGPADAIVVLSGWGLHRVLHGVMLFNQELAPQLWITGDIPTERLVFVSEAQFGRALAIDHGVPLDVLRCLPTSNTWEDAAEIAKIVRAEEVRRLLVVTDWFHARRALWLIRRVISDQAEVRLSVAPPVLFGPDNWWRHEDGLVAVASEYIKIAFYWWNYGLALHWCQL